MSTYESRAIKFCSNYARVNNPLPMPLVVAIEEFAKSLDKETVDSVAGKDIQELACEINEFGPIPPYLVLNVVTKTFPLTTERLLIETWKIERAIPYEEGALITIKGEEQEDWNGSNKLHVTNSFDWLADVLGAVSEK